MLLEGLTGSDLQTAKLVVKALRSPEDLASLRRLAVTHGFVNDRIRAVVWPRLLGVSPPGAAGLVLGQQPRMPPSPAGSSSAGKPAPSSALAPDPKPISTPSSPSPSPSSPSGQASSSGAPAPAAAPVTAVGGGTRQQTPPGPRPLPASAAPPPLSGAADTAASGAPQPLCRQDSNLEGDGCGARVGTIPGEREGRLRNARADSGHACTEAGPEDREARSGGGGEGPVRRVGGPAAEWQNGSAGAGTGALQQERCGVGLSGGGQVADGDSGHPATPATGGACSTLPGADAAGQNGDGDAGSRWRRDSKGDSAGGDAGGLATGSKGAGSDAPAAVSSGDAGGGGSDGGSGGSGESGGAAGEGPWDPQRYLHWSRQAHRDSSVVEVDVARSLWAFTRGLNDEQREGRRRQLKRLLNAVVASHAGEVFYYQGLHDVAGVLLLSLPPLPTGAAPRPPAQPLPQPHLHPHTDGRPAPSSAPATATSTPRRGHSRRSRRSRSHGSTSAAPPSAAQTAAADADPDAAAAATGSLSLSGRQDGANAASTGAALDGAHHADAESLSGGELLAFALLRRLVTSHLRDATRPTLEPVVQLLGLLPHLLAAADPLLARHLAAAGLQPFFALSWFLTWWAHELDDLPPASRLFDFFLASHPLMPLYLGAAAMRAQRGALLACDDMPELHSALTNLKLVPPPGAAAAGAAAAAPPPRRRFTSAGSADSAGGSGIWARAAAAAAAPDAGAGLVALEQLLRAAQELWRAKPPHAILPLRPTRGSLPPPQPPHPQAQLRRRRTGDTGGAARRSRGGGGGGGGEDAGPGVPALELSACVAHAARLERPSGLWLVPPEPPAEWPGPGAGYAMYGDEGRGGLARLLSRASSALTHGRSRSALLSGALLAGMYVAAAVAIGYATLSRSAEGMGAPQ